MSEFRPGTLRIAAAQYPLDPVENFAAWQRKITDWVRTGAAGGADLIVFPEYGLIELAHAAGAETAAGLAATLQAVADRHDDVERTLCDLAAEHGLHILGPSGPRRGDRGRILNTASLVTPAGHVGRQDKLVMTPFERTWGIAPGDDVRVFATAIGRIGVAICYDSEFPLIARAMVEQGCDMLLIPACTERLSGHHRVRTAALARALKGTIPTVLSPTIGDAPWSPAVDRNCGAAGMFVPPEAGLSDTGVLTEGRLNEPGWVWADVDLAAVRRPLDTGEMRNRADWRLQPGASSHDLRATVVDLTDPPPRTPSERC